MITFYLFLSTVLIVLGIALAASLPKLIHSVLCLILSFVGIAFIYLTLNAFYVGFAQILVYVGAIAILLIFAILITESHTTGEADTCWQVHNVWGGIIGGGCFALLGTLVTSSKFLENSKLLDTANAPVKQIGDALMSQYIAPLEILALVLTVALIGGVILVMNERKMN